MSRVNRSSKLGRGSYSVVSRVGNEGRFCTGNNMWECSYPSSCRIMTSVALWLMTMAECHGDMTCWRCGDSWVIYVGLTLSRKLASRVGTQGLHNSNEKKGQIESGALHLSRRVSRHRPLLLHINKGSRDTWSPPTRPTTWGHQKTSTPFYADTQT